MTERQPTHRLLRTAPLLALALAVIGTACEVAGRSAAKGDLTTSTATPIAEEHGILDRGDGKMSVPRSREDINPGRQSLGLGTISWEEGAGPAVREGRIVPPTGYPVLSQLDIKGGLWRSGVRDGDLLLTINGEDARAASLFADARPGVSYSVRVRRGGAEREFRVQLPTEG